MSNDNFEVYDFGYRLGDLRRARKITQKQLGEIVGTHENNISAYESNTRNPSGKMIAKLATALRTSADYLLGIKDEEPIYFEGLSKEKRKLVYEYVELLKKS